MDNTYYLKFKLGADYGNRKRAFTSILDLGRGGRHNVKQDGGLSQKK